MKPRLLVTALGFAACGLAPAAVAAAAVPAAPAATVFSWTGAAGDANWRSAANWSNGAPLGTGSLNMGWPAASAQAYGASVSWPRLSIS